MKGLSVKIRLISVISGMVLFSALAFGQGSCSPDKIALLDTGRPAGGASIRVCTSGSTGTPCTPAASLFTDPTLGTPLGGSPVVTADNHGNWGFCAAAGALYDYQVSCTGCTTLTVKNFPLPPSVPITAASLTSATANPANVGTVKLASGDGIDWRNNANSGNIQMVKTGALSGNTPADALDLSVFGGIKAPSLFEIGGADTGLSRDAAGVIDVGNGSAGSKTGKINLTTLGFAGGGTVSDDGASGINLFGSGGTGWELISTGRLFGSPGKDINFGGATSGFTSILAQAVASGTLTLPAATDTLVGKATTDTLTNKILQGAGSGNTVTLLNEQGPAVALTGNATDQTIYTFTIPANTIQNGKGIRVTAVSKHTTGTGAATYKLKLGATTLDSNAVTGNPNLGNEDWTYRIFNNSGVQNAQHFSRSVIFISVGAGSVAANNGTSAENTANSLALVYSFNAANTEQVTPVHFIVELVQ